MHCVSNIPSPELLIIATGSDEHRKLVLEQMLSHRRVDRESYGGLE